MPAGELVTRASARRALSRESCSARPAEPGQREHGAHELHPEAGLRLRLAALELRREPRRGHVGDVADQHDQRARSRPAPAAAQAGRRWRVQRASTAAAAITAPITPSAQECWSAAGLDRPGRVRRGAAGGDDPIEVQRLRVQEQQAAHHGECGERPRASVGEPGGRERAAARSRAASTVRSAPPRARPPRNALGRSGPRFLASAPAILAPTSTGASALASRRLRGAAWRELPGSPRKWIPTADNPPLAGHVAAPAREGSFFAPNQPIH